MKRLTLVVLLLLMALSAAGPATASQPVAASANLIRVPLLRQATDHTCGVAALQSLLYYNGIEYREDVLAEMLHAADYARVGEIVRVAAEAGLTVDTVANMTMAGLRQTIDRGIPFMVCLQAWPDTPLTIEQYRHNWEDGHWVVVNGYDTANIFVMDPSTLGNYAYVPVAEFDARWHDYDDDRTRPYVHFAIIITGPRPPAYDPQAVLRME